MDSSSLNHKSHNNSFAILPENLQLQKEKTSEIKRPMSGQNQCKMDIKSNSLFTSFSGATFTHTLFTSSDIIQSNLNGIKAYQSSFDDSDFFNSRFIASTLIDTSFRNCNLKKALFYDSKRTNVSFKMSNTREALFTPEGKSPRESDLSFGNSIVDGDRL